MLIFSALFIVFNAYAVTPPAKVKAAFEQKYPKASKVTWGKESATEWEAEFTLDKSKVSANFSQDGTWVETERMIAVSTLPKQVKEAINKQYTKWKISSADKTETAKNGVVYEVGIKSGVHKKEVVFKEDGTPIKE
ncbi:MAG: hypothetical protein JWN56_844 [Sphingobacteriales bacterium]|nr:hypothetical protein [Sphingobacteriales bacterium]